MADTQQQKRLGTRLIDRDERTRTKPMRVLVLGMCRTGTSSICEALRKLGYNPHHMRVVFADPASLPLWQEAAEVTLLSDRERPAHLRGQPPYGRAEFDKLLCDFDAVTDFPGVAFKKQLVEAYPDAKVVLTNREYKSWARSMEDTIWWLMGSKLSFFSEATGLAPPVWLSMVKLNHVLFKVHNGGHYKDSAAAKAAFDDHYALVRSIVPKDNLLEFGPKFEWKPLCEFLGHEIPDEPYPWTNDTAEIKKALYPAYAMMAAYATVGVGMPVVLAWAAWRWQDMLKDTVSGLVGSLFRSS